MLQPTRTRRARPTADADTPLGPTQRGAQTTDPYLLWAEARRFSGYAASAVHGAKGGPPSRDLSCVIELDVAALRLVERQQRMSWWKYLRKTWNVHVTPAFRTIAPDADQRMPDRAHATVVVPTARVLGLQAESFVTRLILSLPRGGKAEHFVADPESKGSQTRVPSRSRAGSSGRTVMAVIDDGFPFLHSQFNDAQGKTRLTYFWDQDVGVREPDSHEDAAIAEPWRTPKGFAYGRELTGKALTALRRKALRERPAPGDDSLYAGLCYPAKSVPGREGRSDRPQGAWAMPRSFHGSSCASLAAGRGGPPLLASADAAANADLIFVQLPGETVADTSGGGLATYVLDALRYILDRSDPAAPLVVNLSYGAAAGPHDGTSVLESALEALLASRKDFALVVPAGNLYSEPSDRFADERRLHAKVRVMPGNSVHLCWEIPAGSAADHHLELWPQGSAEATHALRIGLKPPAGVGLEDVRPGLASFYRRAAQEQPAFGVIHSAGSPLGLRDGAAAPMALLVVAPSTAGQLPVTPYGRWTVTLRNEGDTAVEVHAWIERADAGFGGVSRQSFFPADEPAVCRDTTLTTVANGPSTVVAGGLVGVGALAPLASDTASGPALAPGGRLGPDFSAACQDSESQPYLMVSACRPGDWVKANGTSISAPRVARQIAQLMNAAQYPRGSCAKQLKTWLDQQASGPRDARRGKLLP